MFRQMNPIAALALSGWALAALPAPAQAQGGFDPKPIMVYRASEPRGVKVPIGSASAAQQCARLFGNALLVLYENYSLEIRTPDGRQVTVFFRDITFDPLPEPGVLARARMQGKIESGPFAGATVRLIGITRDTGAIYADIRVVQGAELRDDVPPFWPPGGGQTQGATLDMSFWVLLQILWARGG